MYRATVFLRDRGPGTLFALTASLGDSLWAAELTMAGLPVTRATRLAITGHLWQQRSAAEPGPTALGAGLLLGIEHRIWRGVIVAGEGGYKMRGVWLGRAFEPGPLFTLGLRIEP